MFKTGKVFGGLLAVFASALIIGGVTASADSGPGTIKNNLSGNGSIGPSSPITDQMFEVDGTSHQATAKSTAQFTVKGGQLFLVAVPDLNFGTVDAKTVLNGGEKKLENNSVLMDRASKGYTAWDGNEQGKLIIHDRRGTTGGWKLELSMSSIFAAGRVVPNPPRIIEVTMDLKSEAHDSAGQLVTLSGSKIGDGVQQIVDMDSNRHSGGDVEFRLTNEDNAKLHFLPLANKDTVLSFDENYPYQSDLTWTLVAGA